MPGEFPRSAARLYHMAALPRVGLHADAVGVHQPEVDHRKSGSRLRGLGEQARRLQRVLLDHVAFEQHVGEAIEGVDVVLGGGRQAQALLLVDGRAATLEGGHRRRRHGAEVAGVGGPAIPAHGLGFVAGRAGAARRIPGPGDT